MKNGDTLEMSAFGMRVQQLEGHPAALISDRTLAVQHAGEWNLHWQTY
jgi:hypothetical protein